MKEISPTEQYVHLLVGTKYHGNGIIFGHTLYYFKSSYAANLLFFLKG